jgi:hypothetical protein
VRIDGTDRVELHGPSASGSASPQSARPGGVQEAAETGRPRATELACEAYIRKAAASEEVDLQAVAEARKLLEAGRLDTPEAAARTAEAIIIKGI